MGSLTMDSFIYIFLDLLHYVPCIKDEKVKIEQFLGCLSPIFRERIEFDMAKTLDTTLHKDRICYEHGQLRQENINRTQDKSRTFSNNKKPGFKPHPYRKHNNSFPFNRYFNKFGALPNVPSPNTNIPIVNVGSENASLQVSRWKWQGPYYAIYCPNKTNGLLHNL